MDNQVLELCLRSIVRSLNGDKKLSKVYKDQAMDLQFNEGCLYKIKDILCHETKEKLYKLVM